MSGDDGDANERSRAIESRAIDATHLAFASSDVLEDLAGAMPSRSSTPPIPPLAPRAYEAMLREQRTMGVSPHGLDDDRERSSPVEGGGYGGGYGGGGARADNAAPPSGIPSSIVRDLLGAGGYDSSTTATHTPSASIGAGEDEKDGGDATREDLRQILVGKPARGVANFDKPSGEALEPVKPTASVSGRAKVGWIRINTQGNLNKLSMEKTKIAQLLRVPLRDLRVLEPTTADSYSAAVLCRERAIVVNLEQIKVLITHEEVIMTDAQTSTVTHFLPELQTRLVRRKKIRERVPKSSSMPLNLSAADLSTMTEGDESKRTSPEKLVQRETPVDEFPFEFVALEVALEMVCNSLEVEANKVEIEAKPALEALRKRVDNVNLERVRRMKTRLVRVTGRVSKVREEIQRYLDDDSDMRDMYLSRKAKQEQDILTQQDSTTSPSPAPSGQARGNAQPVLQHALSVPGGAGGMPPRSPLGAPATGDGAHQYFDHFDDDKDLQELEDLLETYFTHIDSTHRSLNGLNEYIDDLEDLIEIELDSQRNRLIQLELILTTATLCLTCFSVVVGIFGMNIKNNIEHEHSMFLVVVILGSVATLGLFALLLRVCRYYRLF